MVDGILDGINWNPKAKKTASENGSSSTSAATFDFFGQPTTTTTPSSSEGSFLSPVFGVSKRLPNVLAIRGGDVLEPTDSSDVDSILIKAGSESKFVVIDFSATWYVVFVWS